MPKAALKATVTVEQTTEVKLTPTAKKMLVVRCEEHAKLAVVAREAKARMKRIQEEVEELMQKEKQGKALLAGTSIDGHKVKMVIGQQSTLNKVLFEELGGDLDILAEATEKKDKKPYIKITAPGQKDDDE